MKKHGGADRLMVDSFINAVRWLSHHLSHTRRVASAPPSSWRWGEIHRTTFAHNMGTISPLLDRIIRYFAPFVG
jgi:hypothetical protein